jgi:threonyl-tRNA synthetase
MKLMREQNRKTGFREVWTPHIFRSVLWKESGHYDAFREKMFVLQLEQDEYAVKPMNCPGHSYIYKSEPRSYRDLPLGFSEFGTVYRYEKSGELSGLMRVRSLTQDDGHMYLREDQIQGRVIAILNAALETLQIFGFDIRNITIKLSTKPEKAIGDDELWERATGALKEALKIAEIDYIVKEGEGAFYGPKIDIDIKDALGRPWQCTTIQLDFFMPERFKLEFVGADGEMHRPVMIHRAILGSLERFIGILIEHYGGAFPTWLSPVQVKVLPITDRNFPYAKLIEKEVSDHGIRVEGHYESSPLEYKIKTAQQQKIPYMIIIGAKEEQSKTVSVRRRDGQTYQNVRIHDFIEQILEEIATRSYSWQ